MMWELSTWSKHVRRSFIEKHGTVSDKAPLPTLTRRFNKPRKMATLKRKRKLNDHRRRCRQPPRRPMAESAVLPPLPGDSSSSSSFSSSSSSSSDDDDKESQSPEQLPESPRRSRRSIRNAARLEPPESPRKSTLRSAARAAAKKAERQAEEDKKTDTEDEGGWGSNVLDAMVDKLGTRKEVEEDIRDFRRKQQLQQKLANFSHADEDGNAVMMTKNATRGFGASSRDANYHKNVHQLVSGGREKEFCTVPKCNHPQMELLHKCGTCKRYCHVLCSMANNLQVDNSSYCSLLCTPK